MKEVITITKCDICKSTDGCVEIKYPVHFTTEQTEGRDCTPYISYEKFDLCKTCITQVIKVTGYGAQGNNKYSLIK